MAQGAVGFDIQLTVMTLVDAARDDVLMNRAAIQAWAIEQRRVNWSGLGRAWNA